MVFLIGRVLEGIVIGEEPSIKLTQVRLKRLVTYIKCVDQSLVVKNNPAMVQYKQTM
jgi:hypothetical protein